MHQVSGQMKRCLSDGRFSWMNLVWLLLLTIAVPMSARAQGPGVRAGASASPDQFYFGGHLETGEVAERLRFRPNLEVGVGDNRDLLALNFEFVYELPPNAPRLPRSMSSWHLYVGGGPALNLYRNDVAKEWHAEGGFNALIGLAHRNGLFTEVKLGALDSPDFRLGVGYTFHP